MNSQTAFTPDKATQGTEDKSRHIPKELPESDGLREVPCRAQLL